MDIQGFLSGGKKTRARHCQKHNELVYFGEVVPAGRAGRKELTNDIHAFTLQHGCEVNGLGAAATRFQMIHQARHHSLYARERLPAGTTAQSVPCHSTATVSCWHVIWRRAFCRSPLFAPPAGRRLLFRRFLPLFAHCLNKN